MYSFEVDEADQRLDKFVSQKCPELSRTRAQKLIDEGQVTVNGRPAKAGLKLELCDRVEIVIPTSEPPSLVPQPLPLKILFEDDDLMVIDKPAGLTVHPAPGHFDHTLANAVAAYIPGLSDGANLRPGIVHRLDKDTSGLIVVAKNPTAHMQLARQFKDRQVSKTYLALVQGHLTPREGLIEGGIGRDPRDRQKMAVTTRGREASTAYRVNAYPGNYSYLEIKPRTGRTHQIRVHLAAIGFPIVGDPVYGARSQFLSRQFLHASELTFRLPSTGDLSTFHAGLPPDLVEALVLAEKTGK